MMRFLLTWLVAGVAVGSVGGCATAPRGSSDIDAGPTDESTVERAVIAGPEHAPGAASAQASVTVATFNVHGLADLTGLAYSMRRMESVDVWLLQEVAVPAPGRGIAPTVERLARVLPAGRWECAIVRLNPADDRKNWEGQAVVSRYPIRSTELWPLRTSGSKLRAALVAEVESPVGPTLVVDTDHEPSFLDVNYGNRKQVRDLGDYLKAERAPVVVVGGDFNSAGNLYRFKTPASNVRNVETSMSAVGFKGLPNRTGRDPTYHVLFIGVQLDHLFARGLVCEEWGTVDDAGSDHDCVWGRYVLKPAVAGR